jgi:CBS-domain-containing membrane protein
MNVEDIMTADVIAVGPETSVHMAARLMSDHAVSGLPVVDADGRVLGLVTEGDLILRQAAPRATHWWRRFFADPEALARDYQKAAGMMVGEVMTREVVSIGPRLDIGTAARILHDRGFRRLPVVHEGRLVGILSRGDLVKALAATPVITTSMSDDELVAAMRERMQAEPWTPFGAMIEASDGVIALTGVVYTEAERSALETMARGIPGCRDVDNRLTASMSFVHGQLPH